MIFDRAFPAGVKLQNLQSPKAGCARVASGCDAAQTSCRVAALPRVRRSPSRGAGLRLLRWTLDNQIMNAGCAGPLLATPLLGPASSLQTLGQDDKFCTCMKLKHSPRTTTPQQGGRRTHTHTCTVSSVSHVICIVSHVCRRTRVSCHMKAPSLSDLLWSCHHSSGENRDRQHQDCFLQTHGNMD